MSQDTESGSWAYVAIGELCHLINGRAFKPSEWTDNGIPIIRIQNLNNPDAPYNYFDGEFSEKHQVVKGDLLFAWSGTPGTSFGAHVWNGGTSVLNQHIFKVAFDEGKISKTFLRYAINQKLDELISGAHGGVGLRHVTKGNFEQTQIAFPPLAEQKVIAAKLDELLGRVDRLKSRLDAIPAILKRFRQSVLAAAVSGKLTGDWRVGRRTSDWEYRSVEAIAKKKRYSLGIGPFGSNLKVSDYKSGGHPLVFVREIRANFFCGSTTKYVNNVKFEELKAHRVTPGNILITKMGDPPGDVCIYPESRPEAIITSDCIKLDVDETVALPRFVLIFMQSEQFRSNVAGISAGVAQQKVNLKKFRMLELHLPPLPEQTEIVRRVEQLFAFADQIEQQVKNAQSRVNHMTQSILAKAFRGDLTAQWRSENPDLISGENSAQALLERIKAERERTPATQRGKKPKPPRITQIPDAQSNLKVVENSGVYN